ncbi:MAG: hemerythrin domain-containing protein [Nocardioides sp.]
MPPIDDETRPRRTRGLALSFAQQLPGQHLRAIHDVFRGDLQVLRHRVEEVRRGEATVADLRAAVHHLTGRRSLETLGGFCAQFCSFVTMHHMLEDQVMFPAVAGLPDYASVAQRLSEEHVVIHEHLLRIDAVLLRLDGSAEAFAELDEAVAALAGDLLSHFTYEETELAEPLGLLGLL